MFKFSGNTVSQYAAPCKSISSKASIRCHKRKADRLMPNSAYAWSVLNKNYENHWATATYITVICGHSFEEILGAMVVGMGLKRTSTRRRICFVNDVPFAMQLLLNTIWEIREFEHLDMSSIKKRAHQNDYLTYILNCKHGHGYQTRPRWLSCLIRICSSNFLLTQRSTICHIAKSLVLIVAKVTFRWIALGQ